MNADTTTSVVNIGGITFTLIIDGSQIIEGNSCKPNKTYTSDMKTISKEEFESISMRYSLTHFSHIKLLPYNRTIYDISSDIVADALRRGWLNDILRLVLVYSGEWYLEDKGHIKESAKYMFGLLDLRDKKTKIEKRTLSSVVDKKESVRQVIKPPIKQKENRTLTPKELSIDEPPSKQRKIISKSDMRKRQARKYHERSRTSKLLSYVRGDTNSCKEETVYWTTSRYGWRRRMGPQHRHLCYSLDDYPSD